MDKPKTPLRYPGGKQKVWRFISEMLSANDLDGGHYVEPYAGGAGVAMELLLSGQVKCIHLNDSCPAVFAFWHSVIHEPDEMCRRIRCASLTVKEWKKQKDIYRHPDQHNCIDLGYAVLFLNRCNRSGIMNGGIIGGKKQNGPWKIDARFSRNDLIARIERIASRSSSIKIRNWDAERYLIQYVSRLPQESLIYCDPPYFNKADRLYENHYTPADHSRLARTIQTKLNGAYWMVSYDNAPEIFEHYSKRRSFTYSLQYNAARAYKGSEVFVLSDDLVLPKGSRIPAIDIALHTMTKRRSRRATQGSILRHSM